MLKVITILFFILSLYSCSEELVYSPGEMWKMGSTLEPDMSIRTLAGSEAHLKILCSQYSKVPGCIGLGTDHSGMRINVRLVELIIIQFDTEENARNAAIAYGQLYARNWLFDNVKNEPVLEDFVKKGFGGIDPSDTKSLK